MAYDQSLKKTLYSVGVIVLLLAIYLLASKTPAAEPVTTVVPTIFAEARGAMDWNASKWHQFRKDPDNQWQLSSREQRSRNGRGPHEWLPRFDQCLYISRFVSTMKRYGLDQDPQKMQRLASQRQRCYTQFQ
ncbi:hypothetical protein [Marinobacter sp. CHS3-4]|uniref:hypothetical protein n=1 Tax=Marinobacter sp. CHS3-4 TaxID=3045174 RepID=UPI0024B4BCDC|nr:hypothetical protein [Marinobacter sp. CHS3-4]MDI9246392.1 hypothetical protein [Marinobacter sp. CHS3-4]